MKKHPWLMVLVLISVVGLAGCGGGEQEAPAAAAPVDAAPAAAAAGSGNINGTITYANGDPDTEIKMDADPVCASLHPDAVHTESIVSTDGALANVFVYVKEGLTGSYPSPADSHLLDQVGCRYTPHVSGMMVGQKLIIRNSDATLHNVHAIPEKNEEFNQGQPFQGMELEKTFSVPEVMVRFKCDVHPWMASYMAVLDHPFFAVSSEDGSFSLEGIPAGDYVLEAWHETLGAQTQPVTVGADATADVSFDFAPTG